MNSGLALAPVLTFHEIVKNVNEKAMLLLHAINGCDTVSSFLGCGKNSAWLAWSSRPSVTDAFWSAVAQW